jgi:hypothetical protein
VDVCTIDNKEVRNKTHIYLEKDLWKPGAEMDQMPFSRLRLFEINFYKAKTKIQSFRFRFVKVKTLLRRRQCLFGVNSDYDMLRRRQCLFGVNSDYDMLRRRQCLFGETIYC